MATHDRKIARALAALGRNMQSLRTARGLTQQEAAELADLHWRHWQKIEAGTINATVASLAKVAAALDVDVGALFAPPPKQ